MEYFSDREQGKIEASSEEITIAVWNGIVAIYEKFAANNSFADAFPENCQDGYGICGFDKQLFEDTLRAEIPKLGMPTRKRLQASDSRFPPFNFEESLHEQELDNYAVLDFLEFCHHFINEPIEGSYHPYFNHNHLSFTSTGENKKNFREDINRIFQRNGIVFFLDSDGQIKRKIPEQFKRLIRIKFKTTDAKLNELLTEACTFFSMPNFEDRVRSLERVWDAFERVKTYYSNNKKVSATQLIGLVANGNQMIEHVLQEEAAVLTKVGNNFQIRHFEKDKMEIKDSRHIDYLFYRLLSLVDLFLKELEK
jgi:hypothetical protein